MNSTQAKAVRNGGFTLIELLVVVTIAAILAAVAVPGMRQLVIEQRVRAATAALQDSLWRARSEAIKRNRSVGLTLTTMAAGWDVSLLEGTPTVLSRQSGWPSLSLESSVGDTTVFSYNSFGRLDGVAAGARLTISSTDGSIARCVDFDAAGRARVSPGRCS
ncbi:MAG: type fimbrial biosis protein FimT [Pseudomonadota bacterium]|jgi:type IV fimbrial biogenesis protein FimT